MSLGKKALIVGAVGTGKTTAYFPNEQLGIRGLPPEETFIIQCAGRGKELPMKGWETVYKADKKVKEGGHYLSSHDAKLIKTVISYIAKSRPEIKNILIDDGDYTLGLEILSSEDKFDYEDWRKLGTTVFKNILDYTLNNPETDRLNIFFNWHSETDNLGKVSAKVGGKMISNYAELEGLFSTILYTKIEFDMHSQENKHLLVTRAQPGYPAKSLPGCFEEPLIPNDMAIVLEALQSYGK